MVRLLFALVIALVLTELLVGCATKTAVVTPPPVNPRPLTVLAWNDLGMHCMDKDVSEMMILPPYNNFHAQLIDHTGGNPRIVTSGVTVNYTLPGNTHSADKSNFWTYVPGLLGVTLAPNIGLTGNGLSGTMTATAKHDWLVTGVPLTPLTDAGVENSYQLATVTVDDGRAVVGTTQAVMPVSWEINCNLCHNTPGISTATDILRAHDRLHGTTLEASKPVSCGKCHAQPALGAPGLPEDETLSRAMHHAHSPRMGAVSGLTESCYACHPGIQTQCLRDVHFSKGMTCTSCHISMDAVADPTRRPWVDEPRCGSCHNVAGHQYEQVGTLYRDSVGHHNIRCAACHNSPHAIVPTVVANDNLQNITVQGHAGTIDTCTACHSKKPDDTFPHSVGD
jgi:hypothetical protein